MGPAVASKAKQSKTKTKLNKGKKNMLIILMFLSKNLFSFLTITNGGLSKNYSFFVAAKILFCAVINAN